MLGYMTEKEALSHGFTHHGRYYGIPVWMSDKVGCPAVVAKWAPMELVMSLFHVIEGLMQSPYGEPVFMFRQGPRIEALEKDDE